jgi:hypothetical protein
MSQRSLEEGIAAPGQRIAEYPLPHGKLVLTLQGRPPAWVEPTLRTLGQLLALSSNWDSYGAHPVDPACAWSAWQLLTAVMRDDLPAPGIVPTNQGGVQLEWHTRGVDLEVEVAPPRTVSVSFEDARTGEAWEKELTEEVGELADCLGRLSRPE